MDAGDAAPLLRSAVDTLPLTVAILDDEGTIRYTNERWRQFGEANGLDRRPDSVGRNYLAVAERADSETADDAAEGLREVLAGQRSLFEFEYPCHGPEERRWFRMRAVPFRHDGDRYVAVAHSNVTERRQYHRRLRRSNERLEQFASAASHDLREPLRNLLSQLRLLEKWHGDDLEEDALDLLHSAAGSAERMGEVIDGLLEYARVDTRGEPFEAVDLDDVLADVRADLRVRIEETDAEITVEPLPTVEGDARQLRQLFQNLLDNAIEHSGEGPPRVSVSAERDGSRYAVSVSDDGPGIDPADQDRIFEAFERGDAEASEEGTGIGLALCKRVVERHGGEIEVDSTPGEGSTFSVTLPAADAPQRRVAADG